MITGICSIVSSLVLSGVLSISSPVCQDPSRGAGGPETPFPIDDPGIPPGGGGCSCTGHCEPSLVVYDDYGNEDRYVYTGCRWVGSMEGNRAMVCFKVWAQPSGERKHPVSFTEFLALDMDSGKIGTDIDHGGHKVASHTTLFWGNGRLLSAREVIEAAEKGNEKHPDAQSVPQAISNQEPK